MTLYRVGCIEYTWLFVNVQFYSVLCISHLKCFFFLAFKQFDSTKSIQLLKVYRIFTWKLSTLLYNLPTIHSIQWYNGLCELIKCFTNALTLNEDLKLLSLTYSSIHTYNEFFLNFKRPYTWRILFMQQEISTLYQSW